MGLGWAPVKAPIPPDGVNYIPSPDGWMESAIRIGRKLAYCNAQFTTDELWRALEKEGYLATSDPRAMGTVMRELSKRNLIASSGMYRRSDRSACHGRPVLIWQSKVY